MGHGLAGHPVLSQLQSLPCVLCSSSMFLQPGAPLWTFHIHPTAPLLDGSQEFRTQHVPKWTQGRSPQICSLPSSTLYISDWYHHPLSYSNPVLPPLLPHQQTSNRLVLLISPLSTSSMHLLLPMPSPVSGPQHGLDHCGSLPTCPHSHLPLHPSTWANPYTWDLFLKPYLISSLSSLKSFFSTAFEKRQTLHVKHSLPDLSSAWFPHPSFLIAIP